MSVDPREFARQIEHLNVDDATSEEHREQLRTRVLDEFDRARRRDESPVLRHFDTWRSVMRHPLPRLAAAVLMVACVGLVFFFAQGSSRVALGDLVDTILEARTARFKMVVQYEGQPAMSAKAMVAESDRLRQELSNGAVNIADFKQGKMLGLVPQVKMATVINLKNLDTKEAPLNLFEQLREQLRETRDLPNVRRESLGEKEIDGRPAVGFRITAPGQVLTIWGDPSTKLPIRAESVSKLMPNATVTMSDFEFNVEMEEELFSLEPPEGYTVQSYDVNVAPSTEQDFIEMLRQYSQRNDGQFPDNFEMEAMTSLFVKIGFKPGQEPKVEPTRELMELSFTMGRGFQFALQLPASAEAHYAGKGVQFDTPETPIFWYKPEGASKYRVVRADLTVREQEDAPQSDSAQRISD